MRATYYVTKVIDGGGQFLRKRQGGGPILVYDMRSTIAYYTAIDWQVAAIDWQIAVIDRSITIDVLSTPDPNYNVLTYH